MPAKATLFSLKGDSLFDFGSGPRNEILYCPFGNGIKFIYKSFFSYLGSYSQAVF